MLYELILSLSMSCSQFWSFVSKSGFCQWVSLACVNVLRSTLLQISLGLFNPVSWEIVHCKVVDSKAFCLYRLEVLYFHERGCEMCCKIEVYHGSEVIL